MHLVAVEGAIGWVEPPEVTAVLQEPLDARQLVQHGVSVSL
jgi:hypothetical protein